MLSKDFMEGREHRENEVGKDQENYNQIKTTTIIMEKKEYQKPQINVIAIETVGMIATSVQYLQRGNTADISSDDVDEDGFFKVD